jgi:hypothetical protein
MAMKAIFSQVLTQVTLIGAIFGSLATNASARLGESREQLIERYGEPKSEGKVELPASDSAVLFLVDNVEIHVEFKSNKAWLVSYRTHKLTSEMEAQFRDANDGEGGVGDWDEPVEHLLRTYWQTSDREVTGVTFLAGNSKFFRFCTSACKLALFDARVENIDNANAGVTPASNADAETGTDEGDTEEKADDENPF